MRSCLGSLSNISLKVVSDYYNFFFSGATDVPTSNDVRGECFSETLDLQTPVEEKVKVISQSQEQQVSGRMSSSDSGGTGSDGLEVRSRQTF